MGGKTLPVLSTSHFIIDLPTLCLVTMFVTVIGGLLLLFSWAQNRSTPALALFGLAYLFGSAGTMLMAANMLSPKPWSICAANALICGAYGMMWGGARAFEGRRLRVSWMMAGAMVFIAAFQVDAFAASLQARVSLVSAILGAYTIANAGEVWFARDRELISRWPTLALCIVHAGFLLARITVAGELTFPLAASRLSRPIITGMVFEALFVTFCLAFLRVNMSKERAELEQRRAAQTDSLTGIANRRAFFDVGASLLTYAAAARLPAALLLLDLDRFKEVNDTAGHQIGDRVLKSFTDMVAASMRPGDVFGRIGGEEFACLLPNASMAEALQTAERLRHSFAEMRFAGLAVAPTVSVGVAMATENSRTLPALLATADRALYRAKADGRNRVAPAPLVLVERSRGEDTLRASEIGKPAVALAPLAG